LAGRYWHRHPTPYAIVDSSTRDPDQHGQDGAAYLVTGAAPAFSAPEDRPAHQCAAAASSDNRQEKHGEQPPAADQFGPAQQQHSRASGPAMFMKSQYSGRPANSIGGAP